jgi:SAM-dependent methyltransferase
MTSLLSQMTRKPLRYIKTIPYQGKGRLCPVCNKNSRKFLSFRNRENAQCLHCGSLERHRFLWQFLLKKTDVFSNKYKQMLHVAPEACFEPRFKEELKDKYLTADLFNPKAMVKMDITNIKYPDETFDIIYCSHVLEHVDNDKKAIKEFFRVLKNDGWAILLVPISGENTFEDPSIIEPAERLKYFGQEDHVRQYGLDYIDRLREAGFIVEVTKVNDLVKNIEATKMGLSFATGDIYYCTKVI